MIEQIKTRILKKTNELDISDTRVNEIIKLLESRIDQKLIRSFFVSNSTESYGKDLVDVPIQICILTPRFLFELSFGENRLKYDYTRLVDLGIPEIEIKNDKVKLEFAMRIPNRIAKIITYNKNEFGDLLAFADTYIKLYFFE